MGGWEPHINVPQFTEAKRIFGIGDSGSAQTPIQESPSHGMQLTEIKKIAPSWFGESDDTENSSSNVNMTEFNKIFKPLIDDFNEYSDPLASEVIDLGRRGYETTEVTNRLNNPFHDWGGATSLYDIPEISDEQAYEFGSEANKDAVDFLSLVAAGTGSLAKTGAEAAARTGAEAAAEAGAETAARTGAEAAAEAGAETAAKNRLVKAIRAALLGGTGLTVTGLTAGTVLSAIDTPNTETAGTGAVGSDGVSGTNIADEQIASAINYAVDQANKGNYEPLLSAYNAGWINFADDTLWTYDSDKGGLVYTGDEEGATFSADDLWYNPDNYVTAATDLVYDDTGTWEDWWVNTVYSNPEWADYYAPMMGDMSAQEFYDANASGQNNPWIDAAGNYTDAWNALTPEQQHVYQTGNIASAVITGQLDDNDIASPAVAAYQAYEDAYNGYAASGTNLTEEQLASLDELWIKFWTACNDTANEMVLMQVQENAENGMYTMSDYDRVRETLGYASDEYSYLSPGYSAAGSGDEWDAAMSGSPIYEDWTGYQSGDVTEDQILNSIIYSAMSDPYYDEYPDVYAYMLDSLDPGINTMTHN